MESDNTTTTCRYCGKEIPKEAIFCYYCRRELITRPERPAAEQQPVKISWLLVAVIALVIIVVLALIFLL